MYPLLHIRNLHAESSPGFLTRDRIYFSPVSLKILVKVASLLGDSLNSQGSSPTTFRILSERFNFKKKDGANLQHSPPITVKSSPPYPPCFTLHSIFGDLFSFLYFDSNGCVVRVFSKRLHKNLQYLPPFSCITLTF